MVVQHNLTAMNANRMLGITQGTVSKTSEKLASGYKINRAADDAAGLSISEKMRKQIRGLTQASLNAEDGISAVQTAEGALNEVQDMLQRMNELSVKASNGTMSETDRSYIQNEIDALITEIDRVAETTKFNDTYLLKGADGKKSVALEAHDAGLAGKLTDNGNGKATFTMEALEAGDEVNIGGRNYTIIRDKQEEAVADTDYTYTAATGASVTIDLTGWTDGDEIKLEGMGAAIDQSTAGDVEALVEALNGDEDFNVAYTASEDEDGNLVITANDTTVTGEALVDAISLTLGSDSSAADSLEGVDGTPASLEIAEGTKLYAAGSDKELTVDEAIKELEAGNKLYTTEGIDFGQTAAVAGTDYTYNQGYSSITIDVSTWGNAADTITFDGVDVADGADVTAAIDELKESLGDKYEFVYSEDDDTLTIKSFEEGVTAENLTEKITELKMDGNSVTVADVVTENEPVEDSVTGVTGSLYAAGGTEALTDEEILEAVKAGDTLYTDAAKREENEITADEAYTMVKEELLKANQVGDTLGTAKVEFGVAEGSEKTAADYAVGDTAEIDGKTYTVGTTSDELNALLDKLEEAAAAGTDTDAIKISFTDANNKVQEWTITPDAAVGTASEIQQTKTDGTTTTTAVDSLDDLKEALKAAAGFTLTIEGGKEDVTDIINGEYNIASDEEGATVVSAEKMAELVNEDAKANPEPSNVFEITTGSSEVAKTLSFNLHVGADADMTNKIQVDIDAMTAENLGVANLDVTDTTGMEATYAVDAIQDAIQKISTQRSALGAIQNRLEHTIKNLDNVVENTTAAESQIRDTDMATEMVKYSNNNILSQAGQSMLAQANQSNQGVLSLLG